MHLKPGWGRFMAVSKGWIDLPPRTVMAKARASTGINQVYEGTVDEAIDLGLFAAGGSFERFPGAVLVAGHNGLVLAANDTATPIAAMLQRGYQARGAMK